MVRGMRMHDTVLRMRELLLDHGVQLSPEKADARAEYEGPGTNAQRASSTSASTAT
jgi:hypothetical protein